MSVNFQVRQINLKQSGLFAGLRIITSYGNITTYAINAEILTNYIKKRKSNENTIIYFYVLFRLNSGANLQNHSLRAEIRCPVCLYQLPDKTGIY